LLFNKRVFVLTYDDGIHSASPKYAFANYIHFQGIERLENVDIIDDIDRLEEIFSSSFALARKKIIPLNYFISETTKDYPAHLQRIVDQIIKN